MKRVICILTVLGMLLSVLSGCGGGGGSAASNNANLSALAVSEGTLSPAFAPDTTSYTDEVASGVASISVTPTAEAANATIMVNGATVESGSASGDIALSTGENTITVIVTAEDGANTKTYTITVTKLAPAEPSHNADLSGLTLSDGTLSPAFSANTTSYSAEVAYTVASITVTPTAAGVNASITVNGTTVSSGSASGSITLNTGANTITVKVTAEDGTTTKTYTITVTKLAEPSHNANLADLTLSQGTLSPSFSSATTAYTSEVPYGAASITVTPTAQSAAASITVNGTTVSSGSTRDIPLNKGANIITIEVNAEDGIAKKTYTVTVTVEASVIYLPKTGQTASVSAGDDGDLQKGVAWLDPRFTTNGDTSVTDTLTGLVWAPNGNIMPTRDNNWDQDDTVNDGKVTWQHALDYVAKLNAENYLSHNDWRLPNRKELRSLVDYSKYNPVLPTGHPFTNVQATNYWSSGTSAGDTTSAWVVNMDDGYAPANSKIGNNYVWPVRSGQGAYASADIPRTGQVTSYDTNTVQRDDGALKTGVAWPSPRFTVASSSTGTVVTDNLTGLMWSGDPTLTVPCSSVTTTTWQGALDYVACLNTNSYLGHADWRLPNVNEFESLVHAEYKKETTCGGACTTNAAWLNSQGFSNVQAVYYWSSSTYAGITTIAWLVNMNVGYVVAFIKTSNYYVWPVRGGQ